MFPFHVISLNAPSQRIHTNTHKRCGWVDRGQYGREQKFRGIFGNNENLRDISLILLILDKMRFFLCFQKPQFLFCSARSSSSPGASHSSLLVDLAPYFERKGKKLSLYVFLLLWKNISPMKKNNLLVFCCVDLCAVRSNQRDSVENEHLLLGSHLLVQQLETFLWLKAVEQQNILMVKMMSYCRSLLCFMNEARFLFAVLVLHSIIQCLEQQKVSHV